VWKREERNERKTELNKEERRESVVKGQRTDGWGMLGGEAPYREGG
jgi:hypothetical protein